ncbi:hypothetical protein [Nocardioides alkalitolerans]|uniref:hypothetical protein n=1 Tax=Nocardioides alkalitolerans TaxID=281714 RepID=UPI000406884A|nr:hypothetical protein [Nocardioides alkalitolerans]
MSWEEQLFALFDDLEQQATAAYDVERSWEVADRSRAEYRSVTLASRLMASVDAEVVLDVRGVGPVSGALRRVGEGWCLVEARGSDWVLRTEALDVVRGASERSRPEAAWSPVQRLGVATALRRLADAAVPCVLHLVTGARHHAVVVRVGSDFLEVRVGERERGTAPRVLLVALAAVAAVQSEPHAEA